MTEQPATTPTPAPQPAPVPDVMEEKKKLCLMLYIIFGVSMLLQFISIWTAVVGTAAVLAGIIMVYVERRKTYGSLVGNHLQWLTRTFWIGGAVYLPIMTIVGTAVTFFMLDFEPLREQMATGEAKMETLIQTLLISNQKVIYFSYLGTCAPFALWWWWRCWYGFKRLKKNLPIPNATSWV